MAIGRVIYLQASGQLTVLVLQIVLIQSSSIQPPASEQSSVSTSSGNHNEQSPVGLEAPSWTQSSQVQNLDSTHETTPASQGQQTQTPGSAHIPEATLTTTSEPVPTSELPAPTEASTKKPIECLDSRYCFNGGRCVINEQGHQQCICLEGFYGNRCQTKDICKSVIVDSLTGEEICSKLERGCFKNDKFFRCSCLEDEYFIFKIKKDQGSGATGTAITSNREQLDMIGNQTKARTQNVRGKAGEMQHQSRADRSSPLKRSKSERLHDAIQQQQQLDSAKFTYNFVNDQQLGGISTGRSTPAQPSDENATGKRPGYLAECRKVDKCLGVRCRQLAEVCLEGKCICNRDAGYVADPSEGHTCKLLDPCSIPANKDETPICGQAKCVATFDRDLFKCLCPVGYSLIQIGPAKNSSICKPLSDAICDVPLLNKCQHLCHIDLDQNNYRCSCFRGYKQGRRTGIDDHMCFFDEHSNEDPNEGTDPSTGQGRGSQVPLEWPAESTVLFRWYKIPRVADPKFVPASNGSSWAPSNRQRFTYDSRPEPVPAPLEAAEEEPDGEEEEEEARTGDLLSGAPHSKSLKPDQYLIRREPVSGPEAREAWSEWDELVARMSVQERCNKMCGENRICVLDQDSTDSYRCICDRQGYVSIGDKCLHWCAAAEFSMRIRALLYKYGCWTQVCKLTTADVRFQLWSSDWAGAPSKPEEGDASGQAPAPDSPEQLRLLSEETMKLMKLSSWRPQFECDCSSSPFLRQDPQSRLCQLDFRASLEPCLPGNVGYIDCVENKNAYCAVLHRNSWSFIKDLIHDKYKDKKSGSRPNETPSSGGGGGSSSSSAKHKGKQAKLVNEKLYTCVCSPDKKFLVDKPRNKERCVDECDMLNIECVRFNRMCRSASIAPDDFGRKNLVRYDLDGAVKMNFRRTGCECLPGFNVGPTESVDFTLDDVEDLSDRHQQQQVSSDTIAHNTKDAEGYPMADLVDSDDILDQAEHMRAKYINIDSSCLLDYDVVEFHVAFKSPADFDPSWISFKNPLPEAPPTPRDNAKQSGCGLDGTGSCEKTSTGEPDGEATTEMPRSHHQSSNETGFTCEPQRGCQLRVPKFMRYNIVDLHKNIVLVAQCDPAVLMQSLSAYQECVRYRYWIIQKLRRHYVDWRNVITRHLSETFDLMDGNIRLRVNRCESSLKNVYTTYNTNQASAENKQEATSVAAMKVVKSDHLDPLDPRSIIDADIECELTLHSASDGTSPRYSRKVLLEKQLQRFIFVEQAISASSRQSSQGYYLMAPNLLIRRESFDQLAEHRKLFNPCESDYAYCDMQTECHMVDTVNFTCTCKFGYTPIGSRDIYYGDSRKEVCEDIDECLFDVCKDLAGVADCENTIGDYKCLCRNQYTGDNKRYCNHVCNTINCHHLHGKCRIVAPHHALCECEDGYKEADCSVQDPNVALRKANMIIVGSIFTSVLMLMITLAISLNSQLKKTKKKLKRLEAISATANLFELHTPQPFRPRMSKAS